MEEARNMEDETRFQELVLENDLSLQDQLKYRQQQLKRVRAGNKEEKRKIREEIAFTKNLIQQEEYADAFRIQVDNLSSGMQSIDATLNWLTDRLAKTTDSANKTKIRNSISELKTAKYTQQQNTLSAQTKYAEEDQGEEVIGKQLEKLNLARVDAVTAGNEDYAAALDLQIQSLNKVKYESGIKRDMLNLSASTMNGQSSLALLNSLNDKIETADGSVPIMINGQRYESAKQFWEGTRTEYLSDRTANGFFGRYKSELSEKMVYKDTSGILTNNSLSDVTAWYDTIKDRPELIDYQERINTDEMAEKKTVATSITTTLMNQAEVTNDYSTVTNNIGYIQDKYGIDLSAEANIVKAKAAQIEMGREKSIEEAVYSYLQANPGATYAEAQAEAEKIGAADVYTPEEYATKGGEEIFKERADAAINETGGDKEVGSIIDPTKEGASFATPEVKEGDLIKIPGSTTVWQIKNGKKEEFVGDFTEDMFKAATGKGYNAVKEVPTVTAIPEGPAVNSTKYQAPVVQQQARGELIADPEMLKTFKSTDIIKEGNNIYLKQGVKNPYGQKISNPNELKKYTKDQIIRAGKNIYLRNQ